MKDPQDRKDQQVSLAPLALRDPRVLWVILARGDPPVVRDCLELMECLVPPELLSCCLSGSAAVEGKRVLLSLHRKLRPKLSCPRPGWR